MPDVKFLIGDRQFTFTSLEYIQKFITRKEEIKCFPIFFPQGMFWGYILVAVFNKMNTDQIIGNIIILGRSFLRHVYTVYDFGDMFRKGSEKQAPSRIGFAYSKNLYFFAINSLIKAFN